jgi:hypothetical protein
LEVPPITFGSTRFRYSLVKLTGTCAESQKVAQEFQKGYPGARLTAAWRVQNKSLLRSFRDHGREMRAELEQDGLPPPQFMLGFHGTRRAEALHSILQDGYDVIYSSSGVDAYGMSVYHARGAQMSNQYACRTPKELRQFESNSDTNTGAGAGAVAPTREQTMLLNILQIGDTVRGDSGQVKPGVSPSSQYGRRYDTFTDGGSASNARIMVTTHNAQAYPAYVLNYERTAR